MFSSMHLVHNIDLLLIQLYFIFIAHTFLQVQGRPFTARLPKTRPHMVPIIILPPISRVPIILLQIIVRERRG